MSNTDERMMAQMPTIGIFDSGLGGLSVLREIRAQLPYAPLLYFADQAHVPYGPRALDEVRAFSEEITRFLLSNGAQGIVVACNTASAAALHFLRERFPGVPFVGMEPAVKPAAEQTRTRVVGVLATPATFQGALYASVLERFAQGVTVLQDTCPGLVGQIERGALQDAETRRILETALFPMLERGIDTVVLGCTHYPFVIPLIRQIVGDAVRVIDPAPAVARQVRRVFASDTTDGWGREVAPIQYYTSGDPATFSALVSRLGVEAGVVRAVRWEQGRLYEKGYVVAEGK
ncbi:MAG: glutamate racemase [Anaerolineales bacterium]|nr:glutamate racemase [Anaerolineales bacterium]MDW8278958.1 glutamate racemase [Anaerolineales bacterium]